MKNGTASDSFNVFAGFSVLPLCSKADSGMLVRVIPMLSYMMDDNSVNVIKRLLVCIVQLYKIALIVSCVIHMYMYSIYC